jgi:hypothetical protein
MNQQDEKKFYKGMVILGLLISGKPLSSIPELANLLIKEIIEDKENGK